MTTNLKKIVNNIPLLFLIIIFFALLKDADLVLMPQLYFLPNYFPVCLYFTLYRIYYLIMVS